MSKEFYDEDYYQHGVETGKSNYQNYRWIPELTIPMAMSIVDYLGIKKSDRVLDYGCALGYLVKALRLLHRDAWGVDISQYAISNADPVAQHYCSLVSKDRTMNDGNYKFCIAKDVLEHLTHKELKIVLNNLKCAETIFVIVPLGKNGKYVAPANNLDKSHIICEDLNWWKETFLNSRFDIKYKAYRVDGIKDAYYKEFPTAHGFFVLGKR